MLSFTVVYTEMQSFAARTHSCRVSPKGEKYTFTCNYASEDLKMTTALNVCYQRCVI